MTHPMTEAGPCVGGSVYVGRVLGGPGVGMPCRV